MDLGVGLFSCQRRDDDRPMAAVYDEALDLVRTADRAGLDSAWLTEHHFVENAPAPGTMPRLGAMAAATEGIRIGTYIAIAPLYHPIQLAEDAATVDLLSDGRLLLGLGPGYAEREFEGFGVPHDERADRTMETTDLLKRSWSPGPLDYEPEFHDVSPDVEVFPKPARKPRPPIVLGAISPPAVRRAAIHADGWAGAGMTLEEYRLRVEHIRKVREEEGLDGDFRIYVSAQGFVGDSREDAWEKMRDGFLFQRRKMAQIGTAANLHPDEGTDVEEFPEEHVQQLRDRSVFGSPEQVVDELESFEAALGEDVHFILRMYYPGSGRETMTRCIERLGSEVLPHVR